MSKQLVNITRHLYPANKRSSPGFTSKCINIGLENFRTIILKFFSTVGEKRTGLLHPYMIGEDERITKGGISANSI